MSAQDDADDIRRHVEAEDAAYRRISVAYEAWLQEFEKWLIGSGLIPCIKVSREELLRKYDRSDDDGTLHIERVKP